MYVPLLQPRSTQDAGPLTLPRLAQWQSWPKCQCPESFKKVYRVSFFLSALKVAPEISLRRRRRTWTRWLLVHLTWQLIEMRLRLDYKCR